MSYFDQPWRALTCAAKLRDWDTIDAIIADQRALGNMQIVRGTLDARRKQGLDQPTPLDKPDPVTIHDLPDRENIEIIGKEGDVHKWRQKKAA